MSAELKEYLRGFFVKVLENLSSAKMWLFMLPFIVSTVILSIIVGWHIDFMKKSLEAIATKPEYIVPILKEMEIITTMFISWCTFNVSLAGTVIVVREVFKVAKLKALNEEDQENSEIISNIEI